MRWSSPTRAQVAHYVAVTYPPGMVAWSKVDGCDVNPRVGVHHSRHLVSFGKYRVSLNCSIPQSRRTTTVVVVRVCSNGNQTVLLGRGGAGDGQVPRNLRNTASFTPSIDV